MIKFKNVSKIYKKNNIIALEDISFEIEKGDFVFLTGASGAGKTTLLRLIFKDLILNKGQIFIDNEDISRIKNSKLYKLRRKIGVIFQDFKLIYNKTVFENIAYPLRIIGFKNKLLKLQVELILKNVGLWYKKYSYPHMLSGGEQQKVAIARALVYKPKIIIADEPTGNLDNNNAQIIIDLFKNINLDGTTILFASHNPDIKLNLNVKILELKEGKLMKMEQVRK